jgi:hypothetical protein
MPIDLHVELLNLVELNLIIYARRNGTFGADELFNDCILFCDYASLERLLRYISAAQQVETDTKRFQKGYKVFG